MDRDPPGMRPAAPRPQRHAGRVYWVTGAGSGIGRATARRLVEEGARVLAADIVGDGLQWAIGNPAVARQVADITDPAQCEAAVAFALGHFGRIDGAVLNAGIVRFRPIDAAGGIDQLRRMLDVNVVAVAHGVRALLPAWRGRPGAAISVTASISGLGGDPLLSGYNASKGAVANLVRALAQELGPLGIRINAVAPGPTATAMTPALDATAANPVSSAMRARIPLKRWAQPDEPAAAHAFLLSQDASFVHGVVLPVDGGLTAGTGQFEPPGPSGR